jgi:LAS superfamily LD-carboxypeptidase LdcB
MRYRLFLLFLLAFFSASLYAQTETKNIRIVDTLTPQEKKSRNPILLKSELDSLIKLHEAGIVKEPVQQPIIEDKTDLNTWLLVIVAVTLAAAGLLVGLFFQQRKRFANISDNLIRQLRQMEYHASLSPNGMTNENDKKIISDMQTKTRDLNARLEKLKTENENLKVVLKEYGRTQAEYEALIKTISKTFKVKKYPGASEGKSDIETLVSLFETERSFTTHVYEQFVRPITAIVDANKNNPSGMSKEQQDKLLELLISLSLLYIEYLYLRVNELSLGGNMVQRINDIKNGLKLNPNLLKKLNTQNGSRALVLRLALEKINLNNLSYPVFEETDLNHH